MEVTEITIKGRLSSIWRRILKLGMRVLVEDGTSEDQEDSNIEEDG
jgi:hypothetical protein